MKKLFISLVAAVSILSFNDAKAQVFTISVTPTVCFDTLNPANNAFNAIVAFPAPGATSYSWAAMSGTAMGTVSQVSGTTGTNVMIAVPNCGTYTVVCDAYTGSIVINSVLILVSAVCPNWLAASGPILNSCPGTSQALSIGPNSYNISWTDGNNIIGTTSTIVVTPTVSTCYTVTANQSGSGCPGTAVTCITPIVPPAINVYSMVAGSYCPGSTFTLTTSPAAITSYTWTGPSGISFGSTLASNIIGCYTLTCGTAGGCLASATICVAPAVGAYPSISVLPSSSICAGSTATLLASGNVISYTWTNGSGITLSNAQSAAITPTASGTYTLVAANPGGCTTGTTINISVLPLPVITIIGITSTCVGQPGALIASGAGTYTWSTGNTGSTVTIVPMANTCYSVIGKDIYGCKSAAASCVTVQAAALSVSPASQTVCQGSGANFTASGAPNYTWATGANTATVDILTNTSSSYTVAGTYSTGCIGIGTVNIVVDTTCTDVWPGDANSDGQVDNTDVFELGFAYGNTGSPRTPGGNAFISQYASDWTGTVSTGKNQCNADCNGDGTINNGDTLAIYNNYSLTHVFKPASGTSLSAIHLVPAQAAVAAGTWGRADIVLGEPSNLVTSLYGVAYDLNFNPIMIQTDSIYIVYTSSFLNAANQNVIFRKPVFNNGIIHSASVRTDRQDAYGSGKIGEVWFKIKLNVPFNMPLNLSMTNAKKTDKTGAVSTLSPGSATITISGSILGLKENSSLTNSVSFFPNPASGALTVKSNMNTEVSYSLFDITGREVSKGSFVNTKTISLSDFSNGSYIVRFTSGSETMHKKLIIEK